MTDQDAKDPSGEPEFATHLHDESTATPQNNAPNATAPDATAMQDMQLSLVDRIADVDDERRRSSTQLRKALQTHKDEVSQRLTGYRSALIGLSALAALLTVGMVGLGLALHAQRVSVAQQIAGGAAGAPPTETTGRLQVQELETRVADIDLRLARLADQLAESEPAALSGSVAALSGQVEALQADMQSLGQLGGGVAAPMPVENGTEVSADFNAEGSPASDPTPGDAPETRTSPAQASVPPETPSTPPIQADRVQTTAADRNQSIASQAADPLAEATSEQTPEPAPEDNGSRTDAPDTAATADIKVEQRRLEAQIAAARDEHTDSRRAVSLPVDQLIDDQLERLEREYQRLARQVDAPAIQSAVAQPAASAGLASGERFALPANPATATANDGDDETETLADGTTQQAQIALQLVGLRSDEEVRAFIAEYNLTGPLYLRSETYRGRPWFAVINGLHDDMESAVAARDALPDDLARLDIWLRELPAGTELERIEPSTDD